MPSRRAIELRKTVARCARAVIGATDGPRAIQDLDDANTAIDAYMTRLERIEQAARYLLGCDYQDAIGCHAELVDALK
jgi:hypothetical protein